MYLLSVLIAFLIVFMLFCLYQAHVYAILGVSLVFVGMISASSSIGWFITSLLWMAFLLVSAFVLLPTLRISVLWKPVLGFLKNRLEPISQTEREALEAGDVWWEKELCSGRPNWSQIETFTEPKLTEEEQAFMDNETNELCAMLDDWALVNGSKQLPEKVWKYVTDNGFLAMVIPKEYGGKGFSAFGHSAVITRIASRSISAAVSIMVPNSLGPAELLLTYGTDEQKDKYLPGLASGKEVPCFALTAPFAGSDATSLVDKGVVKKGKIDGKEVVGIELNWDKRYITLAPIATLIGVAFKLVDPDNLLGDKEDIGITLALVPHDQKGVETGKFHAPMGLAFPNGPTRGKNVFIPLDWVIGGAERVGQGWQMLMNCLSIGRAISLPAVSGAGAQLCYRSTGAYARIREQFNLPIAKFEGVQEGLGELGGLSYLLECTRKFTLTAIAEHIKPSIPSAIAKYHLTEQSRTIINWAMDIQAGKAIQFGPDNYVGLHYVASPIGITVEGANILTRNLIIFGQGLLRAHPYIKSFYDLITKETMEDGDINAFDDLISSQVRFTLRNLARVMLHRVTFDRLVQVDVPPKLKREYQALSSYSAVLALFADICLGLYQGGLKRKERVTARLGDLLSYLYMASALLQGYQLSKQSDETLLYTQWGLNYCLSQLQKATHELVDNLPFGVLRFTLRRIVFPFGSRRRLKQDSLDQRIAEHMSKPTEFRDRLTHECFIGHSDDHPIYVLDKCLSAIMDTADIEKQIKILVRDGKIDAISSQPDRIAKALELGEITTAQADKLKEVFALRQRVINVNEFSK